MFVPGFIPQGACVRNAIALSILAAMACAAEPATPTATEPDSYSARIKALEAEIRTLVDEQSKAAGPGGAANGSDYTAAKARASEAVRRRLQIVEYHLADNDYTRAVDACNAILVEYPHEPATVRLKYRILMAMVERERAIIERERVYRAEEGLADGQRRGVVPKEGPKVARTVFVFDEDIEESDRVDVRRKLQERVTLNYDGVTVGEVLKPLFAIAGINYVILDRALSSETLTLHLVDDTVENALKTIAKLVEVRYNYSANTVFIGAADSEVMVSEIIRLQSGLSDVMTEPQLPAPIGNESGDTGGAGGAAQQQAQPGQQGEASSDLERFLEKVPEIVAGWPEDAKMYVEHKSNTLYVRSTPASIAELKRLLHAMDYQSAQILIEAKFVEVSEIASRALGIDWAGGAQRSGLSVGGESAGLTTPTTLSTMGGSAVSSTNFLTQILYNPSGSLGIKATLRALEEENKAESLAEPRILTLNNAVGVIQLLQSVNFIENYDFTNITTSAETGNNGNTTSAQTAVPKPVWKTVQQGFTLRIRPSLARNDDTITLDIRPTVTQPSGDPVTEVIKYQPSVGADVESLTVQRPNFLTRSLGTTMHIKNGQTVVLGGLTTDVSRNSDNGVPGLRTIPGLGRLFSSNTRSVDRRNLMIFVTAYIIDPSGAKIGEDLRRLRDTAAVVMPEEIRLAEAELRQVEAQRAADATAAAKAAAEKEQAAPVPSRTAPRR
jgi:type II secretory pathway component GspD/PulD (secretin)